MTILRRIVVHAAPCLTGAFSGLVVVLSLQSAGEPHAAAPPASLERVAADDPVGTPRTAPERRSVFDPGTTNRLDDVERRLADLTRTIQTPPEPGALPPEIEADREMLREQAALAWSDELGSHDAEPVDPDWAHEVEYQLAEDLELLAEDGEFRPLGVRCKSTTCSAEVEFESFETATRRFQGILLADYSTNCGTKTLLEDPLDPSQPYLATILYDCSATTAERMP